MDDIHYITSFFNSTQIYNTHNSAASVQHACEVAAAQDGNACLLNVSTDGVSCDVDSNRRINLDYLNGNSNTLALVDNKQTTRMHVAK